jgi:hypothetical protein
MRAQFKSLGSYSRIVGWVNIGITPVLVLVLLALNDGNNLSLTGAGLGLAIFLIIAVQLTPGLILTSVGKKVGATMRATKKEVSLILWAAVSIVLVEIWIGSISALMSLVLVPLAVRARRKL